VLTRCLPPHGFTRFDFGTVAHGLFCAPLTVVAAIPWASSLVGLRCLPITIPIFHSGVLMQSPSRFLISWTTIEYGVIAIGAGLAIIAALQLVGTALS
jgi:hypothetical protein